MHRKEGICVRGSSVGRWGLAVALAAGLQSAFASSVSLVLGDPSPSQPDVGEEFVIQASALFDANGEEQTQLTLPEGRVEYCWIVSLDGQGVVAGIYTSGGQYSSPSGWIEHATVDAASYFEADGDQACEVTVWARVMGPGYQGSIYHDTTTVIVPVAPSGWEPPAQITGFAWRFPDRGEEFCESIGPLYVVGNTEPVIEIKTLKGPGEWTYGYPQWTGDGGFAATGEVVTYTFSEPGRTEVLTCFGAPASARKIRVVSALGGQAPTIAAPAGCMLVGGACLQLGCGEAFEGVTSFWTWEPADEEMVGAMEFDGWGDEGHGGSVDARGLARGPVIVTAVMEGPPPVPDPPPGDDIGLTVVELHSMTVTCYDRDPGGMLVGVTVTNPPQTHCPVYDGQWVEVRADFSPRNDTTEEFMMWRLMGWNGTSQTWELVTEAGFMTSSWPSIGATDANPNAEYRVDVGGDSNGNFTLDDDLSYCEVVRSTFINPRDVTVTVAADPEVQGVGGNVTSTATTDPPGYESMVTWTGGGSPATGVGRQFVTHWNQPGEKTVLGTCKNSTDDEEVTIVKVELTRAPAVVCAQTTWTHANLTAVDRRCVITVAADPAGHENLVDLEILSVEPLGDGQGTLTKISDAEWHYVALGEDQGDKWPGWDDPEAPEGRTWDVVVRDTWSGETVDLRVRCVFRYCVINELHLDMALEYVKWKYAGLIAAHGLTVGTYDAGLGDYGQTSVQLGRVHYGDNAFASENILISTIGHEDVHVDQGFLLRNAAVPSRAGYMALVALGTVPAPPALPPPGAVFPGKMWASMEYPAHSWEKDHALETGIDNHGVYMDIKDDEVGFHHHLLFNATPP